jgi:hypothetical protein
MTKNTTTNPSVNKAGDQTHHHDHSIYPVSFNPINKICSQPKMTFHHYCFPLFSPNPRITTVIADSITNRNKTTNGKAIHIQNDSVYTAIYPLYRYTRIPPRMKGAQIFAKLLSAYLFIIKFIISDISDSFSSKFAYG